jgi:hypothetical protein
MILTDSPELQQTRENFLLATDNLQKELEKEIRNIADELAKVEYIAPPTSNMQEVLLTLDRLMKVPEVPCSDLIAAVGLALRALAQGNPFMQFPYKFDKAEKELTSLTHINSLVIDLSTLHARLGRRWDAAKTLGVLSELIFASCHILYRHCMHSDTNLDGCHLRAADCAINLLPLFLNCNPKNEGNIR